MLNNIRSAHNVGSILRTADCVGVRKVYLVGLTPAPVDRFGRIKKNIAKTALGAEKTMKWEHVKTFRSCVTKLKKEGVRIVALEQAKGAREYWSYRPGNDFALVLGREVEGISPRDLSLCDDVIEIPMRGEKESLNVSVAAGVALFHLFGR